MFSRLARRLPKLWLSSSCSYGQIRALHLTQSLSLSLLSSFDFSILIGCCWVLNYGLWYNYDAAIILTAFLYKQDTHLFAVDFFCQKLADVSESDDPTDWHKFVKKTRYKLCCLIWIRLFFYLITKRSCERSCRLENGYGYCIKMGGGGWEDEILASSSPSSTITLTFMALRVVSHFTERHLCSPKSLLSDISSYNYTEISSSSHHRRRFLKYHSNGDTSHLLIRERRGEERGPVFLLLSLFRKMKMPTPWLRSWDPREKKDLMIGWTNP